MKDEGDIPLLNRGQRSKDWQTGAVCTICQPLFCQFYYQSGSRGLQATFSFAKV